MNPSSAGIWCNPPPPGTDEDLSNSSVKKDSPERAIDRIDPFLKSSEYIKYERKLEHRRRSRSRSRHRRRSRGRHKHRRRRHSSSRSRSRSRRRKRRHSRSHTRSRSRSRSHRRRRRSRSRKRSHSRPRHKPEPPPEDKKVEEDVEDEEEDASDANMFKNDGSFMEMFKKMQEEQQKKEAEKEESKAPQPAFGKRRGGKVLKTGLVQKTKAMNQEEADAQDAWTLYMKEVKRYKEACCDDDSKTRLLVK